MFQFYHQWSWTPTTLIGGNDHLCISHGFLDGLHLRYATWRSRRLSLISIPDCTLLGGSGNLVDASKGFSNDLSLASQSSSVFPSKTMSSILRLFKYMFLDIKKMYAKTENKTPSCSSGCQQSILPKPSCSPPIYEVAEGKTSPFKKNQNQRYCLGMMRT